MIDFLNEWILNIAAVAIILVLVEILMPPGKNKKIINLVSGFILILTIIQPFFRFLNKDISFKEVYAQSNIYAESIFGEAGNAGINREPSGGINAEKIREKQTTEITNIYRKKVIDEIERLVLSMDEFLDVKADLIINEDSKSYDYGGIKMIYVTVYLPNEEIKVRDEHENLNINIKQIEEIKVSPTKSEKDEKNENGENGENDENYKNDENSKDDEKNTYYEGDGESDRKRLKLIKRLEEKISLAFRLEKENIIISITDSSPLGVSK